MKILIVTSMYYPNIEGGAEIVTQNYAETLAELGHEVHVLTSGLENRKDLINDVTVYRIYIKGRSEVISNSHKSITNKISRVYFRLKDFKLNKSLNNKYREFIKQHNFDIVHTSNSMVYMGIRDVWDAAKSLGCKVFHTVHDPMLLSVRIDIDSKNVIFLDKIWRRINKESIKNVDLAIFPSNYLRELHEDYSIKFKSSKIIYNFIDKDDFNEELCGKENIILYVGKIGYYKGIDTLVKAFNELNYKAYKLVLVGENVDYKCDVKNNNIVFKGKIDKYEVYKIMKKSKVLVLPSEWEEAFGMVLIESVFNNTMVLGSDRGAIPEVIGDNNYIFKSADVHQLKEKLKYIINLNNDEYNKKIKEIRESFDRLYTKESFIRNLDLYEKINT